MFLIINTFKIRYDSIGASIEGFYFTRQTPIFGEILALNDAPKITLFGHINNFGSSVFYFYFSKVCVRGVIYTPYKSKFQHSATV